MKTVGELRAALADKPDSMLIAIESSGGEYDPVWVQSTYRCASLLVSQYPVSCHSFPECYDTGSDDVFVLRGGEL